MACLHDQADAWTPPPGFVRIRWDHETFFGNIMVYGETPAADCWDTAAERATCPLPRQWRPGWSTSCRSTGGTGLIHADLHLGNALFHRGAVKLIDFDDCGTGPRLYELAVALWELRDDPDYPAFRDALLAGYRTRRDVDVRHLDDFIALRQVAFDLWYTGTAQVNPAFAATAGQGPPLVAGDARPGGGFLKIMRHGSLVSDVCPWAVPFERVDDVTAAVVSACQWC